MLYIFGMAISLSQIAIRNELIDDGWFEKNLLDSHHFDLDQILANSDGS